MIQNAKRLAAIRRGQLQPRPYRMDEVKAYRQGQTARQILVAGLSAWFLVLAAIWGTPRPENPPADNVAAFYAIRMGGR